MWVYLADRKSHKLVTLPQMVYDLKEKKEVKKKKKSYGGLLECKGMKGFNPDF